jgi:SAM-dependent methyltransferase
MSAEGFFGELYLRSTRPFLSEGITAAECAFLREQLGDEPPVLDLGCGHGRHLAGRGAVDVIGVDGDPLSLLEAKTHAPVARGRLEALPFRDGAFGAAWCWYNTLGTFEDDVVPRLLREVARCLRPGGRFVIQGSNPQRAIDEPEAGYDGPLADGSHLVETARYNPERRRDELRRTLTLPDGRVMAASFFIRYYDLDEWRLLLAQAGLEVRWWQGGIDGSPLGPTSADVIVGAQKRG